MTTDSPKPVKSERSLLLKLGGFGLLGLLLGLCLVVVVLVLGFYIYQQRQAATPEPAVAYILDTSARMDLPATDGAGQTRLQVAQGVLAEAIRPAESSLTSGLRVFGNGINVESCHDTTLVVPYAVNNQTQITAELSTLSIGSTAEAAVTEAIIASIRDLAQYRGPHWLVVVTGGVDSCNTEANQLIAQEAQRAGIDLKTFVIGYEVTETEALAIKGYVADLSDAEYLSAPDSITLGTILRSVQDYINAPSDLLRAAIATAAARPLPTPFPSPTFVPSPIPPTATPEGYQPQSACDLSYSPKRLGAVWVYSTFTTTVVSVEGDLAAATIIEEVVPVEGETNINEWSCNEAGAIWLGNRFDDGSSNLINSHTGVSRLRADPLEVGASWSYEGIGQITDADGSLRPTYEFLDQFVVVRSETVTVPAGTFEALVVVRTALNNITTTIWFVEGIGEVRAETTVAGRSTPGYELVSYSVP